MDYYELLNIDPNATTKQIKKHYYSLAKKYHPDKTNGNLKKCEEFKLLSEAYSTLSNPKKRFIYDLKHKLRIDQKLNLDLSDQDYELLHSYYNQMMNLTEIKFMKLLYSSLPEEIRNKVSKTINLVFHGHSLKKNQLIHLKNIKYIDIRELKEDYFIHLFRSFNDIYKNVIKQIIILTKENTYHLFITSFNYSLILNNCESSLKLNIIGILNQLKVRNYDLIYEQSINLYQYYYGDIFNIQLMENTIQYRNHFDNEQVLSDLGLMDPLLGKRGDLIIRYRLDLKRNNLENSKELIQQLFNT
jgi:curved DNA-binding protein CbpA